MLVLVPAAGEGARFKEVGYSVPKPLVPIAGKPMVAHVLEELRRSLLVCTDPLRFLIGVRPEHKMLFESSLQLLPDSCVVSVPAHRYLSGAVGTVLGMLEAAETSLLDPVLVVNCDNVICAPAEEVHWLCERASIADAAIFTKQQVWPTPLTTGPYSYAEVDRTGRYVTAVYEKSPCTNHMCAGGFFVGSASLLEAMLHRALRSNEALVRGEYYLAPTFNQLLRSGAKIRNMPLQESRLVILGTPEDCVRNAHRLSRKKASWPNQA